MNTKVSVQYFTAILSCFMLTAGCTTPAKVSQDQLEGVRKAAQKGLPPNMPVQVMTESGNVVVAANLLDLPSTSTAETSSGTVSVSVFEPDKMMRDLRLRCVQILRSVVAENQVPEATRFIIQARHVVRATSGYAMPNSSGYDQQRVIYAVSMPVAQMRDPKWSELTDEQVMQRWRVLINQIPTLQFNGLRLPFR